jgi:chromate transport protein ChrA
VQIWQYLGGPLALVALAALIAALCGKRRTRAAAGLMLVLPPAALLALVYSLSLTQLPKSLSLDEAGVHNVLLTTSGAAIGIVGMAAINLVQRYF